jgi:hypothetical protein
VKTGAQEWEKETMTLIEGESVPEIDAANLAVLLDHEKMRHKRKRMMPP